MVESKIIIEVKNYNAWYDNNQVIKNLNIEAHTHEILAIIGPSNSGKTTFLRAINKLTWLNNYYRQEGEILFENKNVLSLDDCLVRKKIGIIFALPQVLPMSIFDNVAYGPKIHGVTKRNDQARAVEDSLKKAYLWDEVKNRLNSSAVRLSGGQQQRLSIARTLAVEPEVILYDEPCSGLDPVSTAKIEEAMRELKQHYTQILVTNNTKQAARISQRCAFFLMGEMIEIDTTEKLFTSPKDKRTDDYIRGVFG